MTENGIEGIIGLWILLSPWLTGYADISIAKWTSVIAGLILIIMNVWSIFDTKGHHATINNEHQAS